MDVQARGCTSHGVVDAANVGGPAPLATATTPMAIATPTSNDDPLKIPAATPSGVEAQDEEAGAEAEAEEAGAEAEEPEPGAEAEEEDITLVEFLRVAPSNERLANKVLFDPLLLISATFILSTFGMNSMVFLFSAVHDFPMCDRLISIVGATRMSRAMWTPN